MKKYCKCNVSLKKVLQYCKSCNKQYFANTLLISLQIKMSQNSCQGIDDLCLEDLLEWYSGSISLIHYACGEGYLTAVKELIECKIDVNVLDENHFTPLHWAALNGHSEIVRLLLANGSDITLKTRMGRNSLHLAAINGQDEIVKLLIDNGINVDVLDNQGNSPLHIAAVNGNTPIANLLIMKGAELELQGLNRWTPFLCATYYKNIDVARMLLKQGANINAVDKCGRTALHLVIKYWSWSHGQNLDNSCRELLKLLVDKGADLTIRDKKGISVLDLCKENYIGEFVLDTYLSKKVSTKMKSKIFFTLEDCIICNNPRQDIFALHPCGHARSCESCCIKLMYSKSSNFKCYLCRQLITDYKKIYI